MWKSSFLELKGENITYIKKNRGIFENNKINKRIFNINEFKKIKINLKHKRVYILVHGEKVYVENFIMPKLKEKYLYNLIEEKLKEKFKNIDNIMFSYKILSDNGHNLHIMVFCMNWNNVELLKNFIKNKTEVKGILPVQFYALNRYAKNIKENNYIFAAFFDKIIYFLACQKEKVVFNELFEIQCKEDFMYYFDEFNLKLKLLIPGIDFKNIEFLNLPYKDVIGGIYKKYKCNDLGEMSI